MRRKFGQAILYLTQYLYPKERSEHAHVRTVN
jgi:hypothetical protein